VKFPWTRPSKRELELEAALAAVAADAKEREAAAIRAKLDEAAPPIPCPACTLLGAEKRGSIVVPRTNGVETVVGSAYGCPHCSAAWFVWDGQVKRFGWNKVALSQHPRDFVPPTMTPAEKPSQPTGHNDVDMPWNRASRRG